MSCVEGMSDYWIPHGKRLPFFVCILLWVSTRLDRLFLSSLSNKCWIFWDGFMGVCHSLSLFSDNAPEIVHVYRPLCMTVVTFSWYLMEDLEGEGFGGVAC